MRGPQTGIWIPVFTKPLFTIAKIWKKPVSINRWINKEDVYAYAMVYYSVKKKKKEMLG